MGTSNSTSDPHFLLQLDGNSGIITAKATNMDFTLKNDSDSKVSYSFTLAIAFTLNNTPSIKIRNSCEFI